MKKTKAKGHSRSLVWIVLTLVVGLAFALWMPLLIVTSDGLHWLNYVIYWGAAWAWVIPFMRWMRHNRYRGFLHRIKVFGVLLLVWICCGFLGMFATGHGLLPPQASHHNVCYRGRHGHYDCYLWEVELPSSYAARYGFLMQITAQQLPGLPIARVTDIRLGVDLPDAALRR
jgi:hypothetical protein